MKIMFIFLATIFVLQASAFANATFLVSKNSIRHNLIEDVVEQMGCTSVQNIGHADYVIYAGKPGLRDVNYLINSHYKTVEIVKVDTKKTIFSVKSLGSWNKVLNYVKEKFTGCN